MMRFLASYSISNLVIKITGMFFLCILPFLVNAQEPVKDSIKTDTIQPVIKIPVGKGSDVDTSGAIIHINSGETPQNDDPKKKDHQKDNKTEKSSFSNSVKDTIQIRKHNPKAAAWMSVAIPGLGQIYNKKYWKLPIIYVGLGVCGYFVWTNTVNFRKYKETYRFRLGVDSLATDYFPNETDNTVKEMKEYHHKNIEISYIAAGIIYLLNIVDATVDAHLYDFDISDDLSMRIEPTMNTLGSGFGGNTGTGVKLTFKF